MDDTLEALQALKWHGTFFAQGTVPLDNLRLSIQDVGPLTLPLTALNAKQLIQQAEPAAFGWRDKTLIDKNVRDAWEIPRHAITVEEALWHKALTPLLEQFKHGLGVPDSVTLTPNLHKLIIYGPGQFFHPHQDTEKDAGMVASLVVILPSAHQGGDLVIDHYDMQQVFQTSHFPLDTLTCMAFYADCYHEVKSGKPFKTTLMFYTG